MQYVHGSNIIHRDLKLANVLLNKDCEPCICDFGLAKYLAAEAAQTMNVGTPLCMAPELFDQGGENLYTDKIDVYAYGVMIYQMFSDNLRLDDRPDQPFINIYDWVERVRRGARLIRVDGISDFYWDLITGCWAQGPARRPTFAEIVAIFRKHREKYALPGCDLKALEEYENRIMAFTDQKREEKEAEIRRSAESTPPPPKPRRPFDWN
jgi:serine/threonine protein kinase